MCDIGKSGDVDEPTDPISLIVFAENIHLNLNRPTKIAVCAPGFSYILYCKIFLYNFFHEGGKK